MPAEIPLQLLRGLGFAAAEIRVSVGRKAIEPCQSTFFEDAVPTERSLHAKSPVSKIGNDRASRQVVERNPLMTFSDSIHPDIAACRRLRASFDRRTGGRIRFKRSLRQTTFCEEG